MSILYVLIPIAILLTILGIYLFFWAVKTEQFTDLEKEGLSILFDEDTSSEINKPNQTPEVTEKQSQNIQQALEKSDP